MTPSVETSYTVSPRVVLTPGDQFRVTAGPYYRSSDGTKTPMAARGTMTFIAAHRRGQRRHRHSDPPRCRPAAIASGWAGAAPVSDHQKTAEND